MKTRRAHFVRDITTTIALAAAFSYGGGFWLHLLHTAAAVGDLAAWLRDATLLLPAVLLGALLGGAIAHRATPGARPLALALMAVFASLAAATAGPLYAWAAGRLAEQREVTSLFICSVAGVEAGGNLSLMAVGRDLLLLLPANLALAGLAALLLALPGRLRAAARLATPAARGAFVAASAVLVATLSPFGGLLTATPVAAASAICEAGVTPQRSYEVVAINVNIPYNRWGDHDPDGMMFALADDESAYKSWDQPLDPANPAGNRRLRPRPLVLRANAGECIKVSFTNRLNPSQWGGRLTNPRASMHAIGVAYNAATSDGGSVGYNPDTTVGIGERIDYYWLAPAKEGIYLFRDTAAVSGSEADGGSVAHGLFGALAVEPSGSRWYDPVSGKELYTQTGDLSGDLYLDAMIVPPSGESFRETVQLAQDEIPTVDKDGQSVPSFGFNYGAEPEHNRDAERCPDCIGEETSLSSWVYGDPAMVKLASGPGPWRPSWQQGGEADPESCGLGTPGFTSASCWTANVTRAYRWDRFKLRYGLAMTYETHIFHLHANQWRAQPDDQTSTIIDSQTFGPGDGFTADLLGGAGSYAGTVGDSIFHCHLYPHFAEGFWALLRVHDALEDGTKINPDGVRVPALAPLPGSGNLEGYTPRSEAELGRPGFPRFIPGAFGWRAPQPPLAMSEQRPENLDADPANDVKDNPATLEREDLVPGVRMVAGQALDATLNPASAPGLTAEQQAMDSVYAESAALGARFSRGAPKPGAPFVDPCPVGSREITYNVSIIQTQITYNEAGWFDSQARILVLDEHLDDIMAGRRPAEPLFMRVNAGDCINFNLTNRLPNWFGNDAFVKLAQTNMMGGHIHLVKFDVLASDGSSNGWNYQQAAFTQLQTKFKNDILAGAATCSADEDMGACRLPLPDPADYSPMTKGLWPGQTIHERWWADTELRTIFTHDHHFAALDQNRGQFGALLVEPAGFDFRHPSSGEFFQPINRAGNGPVCGVACNGRAVGTRMDLIGPGAKDDFREFGLAVQDFVSLTRRGGNPASRDETINAPGEPEFFPRHDPGTVGINYRNAPLQERQTRNGAPVDPAYSFSSHIWGDPQTPLLEAYAGDPVQFRLIQGSQEEQHTLSIHGLRWRQEPGDPESQFVNSVSIGISEAFNAYVPTMSCGWDEDCRGDYLYTAGSTDGIYQGMWGIFRVYGRNRNGLLPLPDTQPQNMNGNVNFRPSGTPPPLANNPGTPCVPGAPVRRFTVVAHDADIIYNEYGYHDPYGLLYTALRPGESVEQAMARGAAAPEPMVLRATAGDCIEVTLHNRISQAWLDSHGNLGVRDGDPNLATEPAVGTPAGLRVSLHPGLVQYDVRGSDGATVGYNRDQTVGPGESITYRWYADEVAPGELGATTLLTYGDVRGHRHHGLSAGLVIAPRGATFHDPRSGAEVQDGAFVDVRVPGQPDFRDLALFYQDGLNLRRADGSFVLDPTALLPEAELETDEGTAPNPLHPAGEGADEDIGEKGFSYGSEPLDERLGRLPAAATAADPLDGRAMADLFSSFVHGDPATPILRAYAGDPVRVRLLQTGDRPRQHVFQIGGHAWLDDPWDPAARLTGGMGGVSVGRAFNLHLPSAGSALAAPGDYRYGSLERNHFEARGLWGIFRVYGPPPADPVILPGPIADQDNPYTPGYYPLLPLELTTVTATVFADQNKNATRGSAEPGLAGVTVNLRAVGGGVLATGVTDAEGRVVFQARRGLYDLELVTPEGYSATTPALLRTDAQVENSRIASSFGLLKLAAIEATLINDGDGDGLRSPGEGALSGWTVRLMRSGTAIATATSDAEGKLRFANLQPGDYKLSVTPAAGWYATNDRLLNVTLGGADIALTAGFAVRAGLSVELFNDANGNGRKDSGERPLSDWRVTASGGPENADPVAITSRTGSNGAATFVDPAVNGLLPGGYSVTIAAPRDWKCVGTPVVSISAGTAGAVSSCADNNFTTVLLADSAQSVSLGYRTPNHTVVAEPFNDLNRNGTRESGEGKLIGWTAVLRNGAGQELARGITGNDGRVTWPIAANYETRSYTVELLPPAATIAWEATRYARVSLSVQAGDTGMAQVGFVQLSTVGLRIFEDHDQDGQWDAPFEGPLANRNVVLYDRNNKTVLGTAVSDAGGGAAFKITAGRTYYVEILPPTGWTQTTPLSNGTPVKRLKLVAPVDGSSLEFVYGQYNTADTTPPPAPVLNATPGSYDSPVAVTVESEQGARFRYTLDGSVPTATTGYPLIDPAITIAARGTTSLRVIAIDRAGNISAATSGDFSITYAGAPVESSFATSVQSWTVLKGGIAQGYAYWMAYLGDGLSMTPRSVKISGVHIADGYGTLSVPAGQRALTSITLTLADKHSRTGVEQIVSLYNFQTGSWDVVIGPRQSDTAISTQVATVSADPIRYVDQASGELRIRIASSSTSASFTNTIDQLAVRLGYMP